MRIYCNFIDIYNVQVVAEYLGSGIFASALNQQQPLVTADASNRKVSSAGKQAERAERERASKSQARDRAPAAIDSLEPLVERPLPKSVTMPSFAAVGAAPVSRRPEPAASAASRAGDSERPPASMKTGGGAIRQQPQAAASAQQVGRGSSVATASKAASTAAKTVPKPAGYSNPFDEVDGQQNYPSDKNPFAWSSFMMT